MWLIVNIVYRKDLRYNGSDVIQRWRERHRANTRKGGGRGERKDGDKERGNMVEKEKEREKE